MKLRVHQSELSLVEGDLTLQDTEAIGNAANSGLRGGGGVDGAIHRAGGPSIMAECRKIGTCPTGEARITAGGRLKAKYVIHAVGPVYQEGQSGEAEQLAGAYRSSLELASQHKIKTIAFPSISTGVYAYPLKEAAKVALSTVIEYLKFHPEVKEVRFVLFGEKAYGAYQKVLEKLAKSL